MKNSASESTGIIAPPPVLYLSALTIGFILHIVSPLPILDAGFMRRLLGGFLFLVSGGYARWAFVTLRDAGTSADPRAPSVALVSNGPFRFSRNPIYVAMTGLYLGVAFLINSWWLLALLVPLLLIMQWGVILREERYLAKQFGEVYLAYKANVRRWF